MANEEMWEKLFKRVASFKTELKPTATDARDAFLLGSYALRLSFALAIVDRPSRARKLKDMVVGDLKERGLSRKRIETIGNELSDLCDTVEKTK
jgi:hypothetical protein